MRSSRTGRVRSSLDAGSSQCIPKALMVALRGGGGGGIPRQIVHTRNEQQEPSAKREPLQGLAGLSTGCTNFPFHTCGDVTACRVPRPGFRHASDRGELRWYLKDSHAFSSKRREVGTWAHPSHGSGVVMRLAWDVVQQRTTGHLRFNMSRHGSTMSSARRSRDRTELAEATPEACDEVSW
jgi:hypothetical protein